MAQPSAPSVRQENGVKQSALVCVMAVAWGNMSVRRGGRVRRKDQLPIVQLVTFSVILLLLSEQRDSPSHRQVVKQHYAIKKHFSLLLRVDFSEV